jgi:hypothetical protein
MEGLNRESAPALSLVSTVLDEIRDQAIMQNARKGKVEAIDPQVFTQRSEPGKGAVHTTVLGGGGYFDKNNTTDIPTRKDAAVTAPAYRTTIIAEFSKNLSVPRTFMRNQQQSAVSKAVTQQTKTWLASRDQNAAYAYAYGFTVNTTIDSVFLFSNSHVNQNQDTVDNYETGLLSDGNLNVVVNSLRQQLAQTGVKLGYEPDFLFVPAILHETGAAITKSVLRAGGANNDLNYWSDLYPEMKCVYSPFLDDVSTTAYFVGAQGHGVERMENEAFFTDLVDWKTHPQDLYTYKMRAQEEVDTIEYSGVVGSDGTTS